MPQYYSPGVYIEEVQRGTRPIEGVGTAVAAFVGFTEKGPREATLVTSWEQYRSIFGDFIEGAYLPTSVYGYFLNGGTRAYIMRVTPTVSVPQRGSIRPSLEVSPLLSAANNKDAVSVEVAEGNTPDRYNLIVRRGSTIETFENLSSDPKDKSQRYVENIVNQPLKGSKLVRVQNVAGTQGTPENLSPKAGSYTFNVPTEGEDKPAELPAPAVRFTGRASGDAPVLEVRPAGPANQSVTVEVAEIAGQDELFKLLFKSDSGETESYDVSFKKGPQYLETVINGGKTASKLVRVKDLSADSQANPADRRPGAGQSRLNATSQEAPRPKGVPTLTTADFTGDVVERTGVGALEALDDVTMVAMPDLMSLYVRGEIDLHAVKVVQTSIIDHCNNMHNRVAILDAPPNMNPQQIRNWRLNEANYDSAYATLYYPWIEIDDPVHKGKTMFSPPSGHMAGIWARNDSERGVFKAPANEIVRGAVGLERQLTMGEQDGLNPEGINCIRSFPGRGIRVWGARTLSSDAQWRYLNVRRLFNFIEASIERGTQWIVFEPNNQDLWERIKRDINAFLYQVWMDGALFGATPEQAYFVKCDAEINPPESVDAGKVIIEIGIAPVKPAEFVIFRIGQIAAGSDQ